ncbi:dTMP kinase [Segnochrobactraceae bacterium EtOH-i3]
MMRSSLRTELSDTPRRRPHPGWFLTLEGGEGAGKSTQIARLARDLGAAGHLVVKTREPGGTPFAEDVRRVLLSGGARRLGVDAEAMLFAAARADHVQKIIRPALEAGQVVLCDRFLDSSRVYQGAAGCNTGLLRALERVAIGTARPDLTLILDLPAAEGLARARRRAAAGGDTVPDRFEGEALAVHEARRAAFRALAAAEPERCVLIDASGSPEQVAAGIRAVIRQRLPTLGLAAAESI